jgi:histidinol-phosphate aminotransferase
MLEELIRPEIRSFIPYNANQQPYKIKLDANESPFNMPLSARKKLADFILRDPQLNLYPDTDSIQLREALAGHWGVDKEGIIVGTGSDQLIQVIANVFIDKGDKVLYPAPSFGMYKDSCIIAGGTAINYVLEQKDDYSYSAEKIIKAYEAEHPKIVYICSPNNPTGNLMPEDEILKVVKACKNAVVVVDEAYAEFSDTTVIPYVEEYQNLLVLRTFSKAFGLAGVRCGYSLSSESLAKIVNLTRPPYNISSLSQYTAALVLSEKDEMKCNISYLVAERERVSAELAKIRGIHVYNSAANFILVKVRDSKEVYRKLCERGVFIRVFGSSPLLEDCMRISIGTHEQNSVLLDELNTICYNE